MSLSKLDHSELCKTRPRTPMPADFEQFWKARMAEADAVPLRWKLVPSDEVSQAQSCGFYDLWFEGMGGSKLYV